MLNLILTLLMLYMLLEGCVTYVLWSLSVMQKVSLYGLNRITSPTLLLNDSFWKLHYRNHLA